MKSLRTRIIVMGLIAAFIPVAVILFVTTAKKNILEKQVGEELSKTVESNLETIAQDTYALCLSQQELLDQTLNSNLNVARDIMQRNGRISLSSETVEWKAINQFSQAENIVNIPKMNLGGNWLGQNRDQKIKTPLVDDATKLTGGTCTVFQRMNSNGDMLRVATNVINKEGKRAIGTYIPSVNPDGKPNPVVESVLNGKTYTGVAFVVDSWYVTKYEPIKDSNGNIIGMLYVGVKQESVDSLRQAILKTVVGKTGYVSVLKGSGTDRGSFVISRNGEKDGENFWEYKNSQDKMPVQDNIEKAISLKPGEVAINRYKWQEDDASKERNVISAVTYFEPWDWVIGVTAYEDEFRAANDRVNAGMNGFLWATIISALIAFVMAVFMAAKVGNGITSPILKSCSALKALALGDVDETTNIAKTIIEDKNGKKQNVAAEIEMLSDGVNGVAHNIKTQAEIAEHIASGNLDVDVIEKSDRDILAISMKNVVANLQALVSEANMLSKAAIEGKLNTREIG
ncbi:MAG: Cache 3/Cache 2 fusion domain-containing protein, partial [Armatimonadota bacterium]